MPRHHRRVEGGGFYCRQRKEGTMLTLTPEPTFALLDRTAMGQFFFFKSFLAAARRSSAIFRSSLPSQKSINNLAKAIRCSTWKLSGRPRRRHISSNSARCSSDIRMLYWSVFLATPAACQTRILNSCGNMIDNGMQCYLNLHGSVFQSLQKLFGFENRTHD